jgi:multidrug resistance efflux pump
MKSNQAIEQRKADIVAAQAKVEQAKASYELSTTARRYQQLEQQWCDL